MLRKIILSLIVIVCITTISCSEDFLETTPTDSISASDALATPGNMQLVLNGINRLMFAQTGPLQPGGGSFRAGNQYYIPLGDNLVGDVIHSAPANNLSWQNDTRWISHNLETSITTFQLWYHRYGIIQSANLIINRIAEGDLPLDGQLSGILAQAHAYRAYAYFSLIRHFARGYIIGNPSTDPGVPLLFESVAPFTSGPRATVQEIYNQIDQDLIDAVSNFQNADARPTGSDFAKSIINIDVARALQARVALTTGRWQDAIDAAVLARQGYPIMGEADFKSGFNSNSLPEVIWGSNVISTETTFFRSYFYLMSNTFNGSQVRNNPKIADRRLVDAIPDTDYRKDLFLIDAPNSNTSASNGLGGFANNTNPLYPTLEDFERAEDSLRSIYGWTTRHNTHPYMHVKQRQAEPGGIEPDDIIYIRSSEMYLIEAEAEAMLGNLGAAQEALRPLVEERDSAFDVLAFNTIDSFLDQLRFQRRVELWGEGFGYTDHVRWDEGFDHAADGGSGASLVLYQNGFVQERPSINNEWIFKIPQAEIDANPNITPADQN